MQARDNKKTSDGRDIGFEKFGFVIWSGFGFGFKFALGLEFGFGFVFGFGFRLPL